MHNWPAEQWAVFFGALGTFLTIVLAGITTATVKILTAIREVHLEVNSRMDELIRVNRIEAIAIGRQTERDLQIKETD